MYANVISTKIRLINDLDITNLRFRLLYVTKITSGGASVSFNDTKCFVKIKNKIVATYIVKNQLYYLDVEASLYKPADQVTSAQETSHV